ncbi:WXG100 family type VII secretion target [Psychromicrobium silvestre]|uniref:WXG100 family type VII secretion target n=1 Tax=Psychromicrobium silvestre TaxID=1645614 RepID=A0A7Y9LRY9_9MICC|nr:WXG100 family type VII secretion target [Psychromicrobium silvestre]
MSEFQVASEAIRGAGSGTGSLVAEFEARLTQCNQVASALVGGSWSGPASEAFGTGWAEWSQGAAEVHQALAGIARLLGEAAITYETTESTVTNASASSSVVSATPSLGSSASVGGRW